MLVDATWQGQPRKLLLQANRNGFFYVLDRTNGKLLLGQAVREEADLGERDRRRTGVRSSIAGHGADGRGHSACARRSKARPTGISTSFNPATGLYYVQTHEKCGIFTRTPMEWEAGQGLHGRLVPAGARRTGAAGAARDRHPDRQDRVGGAADPAPSIRGAATLSTAGGLVFFGEDSGALIGRRRDDRQGRCGASRPVSSGRRRR